MISEYDKRVIIGLLERAQELLNDLEEDDQDGRVSSAILCLDDALEEARKIVAEDDRVPA